MFVSPTDRSEFEVQGEDKVEIGGAKYLNLQEARGTNGNFIMNYNNTLSGNSTRHTLNL